jgi:hypothetical protein
MKKIILLYSVNIFCSLILHAQNVGIKTTTPLSALDINGDFSLRKATLTLPAGGSNNVDVSTNKYSVYDFAGGSLTDGAQIFGFTGGTDGRMITIFNNSTTAAMQIMDETHPGSLSSLAANRVVTGSGNAAVIYQNGSVSLRYDGQKQRWTIISSNYTDGLSAAPANVWSTLGLNIYNTNSGNIGMGISTPIQKLHVAGNIKSDTLIPIAIKLSPNAASGKILTSDANGNASWQSSGLGAGNVGYGVWGDCATNANIGDYQPLVDTTGLDGDNFGNSVAISGNFALVGAPLDDVGSNADQGSISFYIHNGTQWILMQKITDASGAAGDNFGWSISLSGNYAIVGAPLDDVGANTDQGSVSVYQYNGTNWVFQQFITDVTGAAADNFGWSVTIKGNNFIVGAYLDDVGAIVNQGSANIYQYNGTSWVFIQKIFDATGFANEHFGSAVSIDGNFAIVGAELDNIDITGEGSASFYKYNGSSWVFMQQVNDGLTAMNDYFGNSVSIYGNYAIVGAYRDNINQGSASIFRYNGTIWVFTQKILGLGGQLGKAVFIADKHLIVGTHLETLGINSAQGTATIYQRVGTLWQRLLVVAEPQAWGGDRFGTAVALDGLSRRFVVGAIGYAASSGKVVFGKIN